MEVAAAMAEQWRRRTAKALPYDERRMPTALRAFFLPEMRPWLVRVLHKEDELRQICESHAEGAERDAMADGIAGHHRAVAEANPSWLLALVRQVAEASDEPPLAAVDRLQGQHGQEVPAMLLGEFRQLVHKATPWWA